jgi:hypothetical protein
MTVDGAMETFAASLLVSVMVMPPAGAAVDKLTGKAAVCPSPTVAIDGKTMSPKSATLTLAVTSARLGRALA